MGKRYSLQERESVYSACNSLQAAIGVFCEINLTQEARRAVRHLERGEKILTAIATRMGVDIDSQNSPMDIEELEDHG